jgi:ankyrin repeat protein
VKPEQKALRDAIVAGDTAAIAAALSAGADINCSASLSDNSPLSDALSVAPFARRFDVVRFLVEHGANVNYPGSDGCRPLFHAVLDWQDELFEYLLSHGADPNFQMCSDPETLFDWAVFDYMNDCYNLDMPEERRDDEEVVDWLSRMATKYSRPQPRILEMLKRVGAKRWQGPRYQQSVNVVKN